MGYGDEIMATGLARGFHARGRLAAFGDGSRIFYGPWSEEMFRHNPNIAKPSQAQDPRVEWIAHYKGKRMYNRWSAQHGRWIWNYNFKVTPGEFFFDDKEAGLAKSFPKDRYTVMEPNVPWQKKVAGNKDWGEENYESVNVQLQKLGHRVVQFIHKNSRRKLSGATYLEFQNFRDTLSVLSRAGLYVGPEGGMHHASGALGIKAVVLMGGFIPPAVVGYDFHVNLTGGETEACGNTEPCVHCRSAMKKITPDQVVDSVNKLLEEAA